MVIFDWCKRVIDHGVEGERQMVRIILVDEAGSDKATWEAERACPIKYDPPDFSAKGNEVAIETLELVHEGLKRVA